MSKPISESQRLIEHRRKVDAEARRLDELQRCRTPDDQINWDEIPYKKLFEANNE